MFVGSICVRDMGGERSDGSALGRDEGERGKCVLGFMVIECLKE